jgi:hypothetical protein
VVTVFATGHKVRGNKPRRGRWILKAEKIRSTPFFGGEVKPSVSCRKMLKNPTSMKENFVGKINGHFLQVYLDSLLDVCADYCKRALVDE